MTPIGSFPVRRDGRQLGTFSQEEIAFGLLDGEFGDGDQIHADGRWVPLSEYLDDVPTAEGVVAASPAWPTPAPVAGGTDLARSQWPLVGLVALLAAGLVAIALAAVLTGGGGRRPDAAPVGPEAAPDATAAADPAAGTADRGGQAAAPSRQELEDRVVWLGVLVPGEDAGVAAEMVVGSGFRLDGERIVTAATTLFQIRSGRSQGLEPVVHADGRTQTIDAWQHHRDFDPKDGKSATTPRSLANNLGMIRVGPVEGSPPPLPADLLGAVDAAKVGECRFGFVHNGEEQQRDAGFEYDVTAGVHWLAAPVTGSERASPANRLGLLTFDRKAPTWASGGVATDAEGRPFGTIAVDVPRLQVAVWGPRLDQMVDWRGR